MNEQLLIQENPTQNQSEAKPNCSVKCIRIYLWFLQILTWLLLLIVIGLSSSKDYIIPLCFFSTVYLLYVLNEVLLSPTSKYLRNINTNDSIFQKIGSYFKIPPQITFHCSCFHYVTYTRTYTDAKGNISRSTVTERVVTHSETLKFPYYSVRDVSGLFYLNCDPNLIQNKSFIKLELSEEINFADAISYMDYLFEKTVFCEKNKNRDEHFLYDEKRVIPGIIHHNLIKLRNEIPFTINIYFFVLASLLTCAEFYKSYVNSCCIEQNFKIRKIVSTRYDLNQPDFQQKYSNLIPKINLISQTFDFQPQDYNYLNSDCPVNIPTQNELNKAQELKDKIPEYQISQGEGQIQNGVIIDKPEYSSYLNDNKKSNNINEIKENNVINNINNNPNDNKNEIPMIQIYSQQGYHPPQG